MAFGILVLLFLILFGGGLLGTIFWIWMLVECATRERNDTEKIVWVLIIIFTHILGAALYFFIRRPARIEETGR